MTLTAEQIATRQTGIGGSDAAVVLGLSRFKTALQLYLEKRGELPIEEPPDSEVIWWGRALEPIVRQRYSEDTGRVVLMPAGTLAHAKHPFMLAHVDGLIQGEPRGYEGKTAFRSTGWGEEGTDQIPRDALLQVHHYLTVTNFEVWDIAVLIQRHFQVYEVKRDLEMSEMLIATETDFMRRVREGDPPSLDYDHPTARDIVRKLYPGTTGVRMDASPAAIAWREQLAAAQAIEKSAKANIESLKSRLLEEMGEAALLAYPDGKCHRRQKLERAGYSVEPTSFMDFRIVNDPQTGAKKR